WTPTEAQGPGLYILTTLVTGYGVPGFLTSNSFAVTVNEINLAPILPEVTNQTASASHELMLTNTASDPDLPANALTYTLLNAPEGASVDTNGIITWLPGPAQAPGVYTFTTVVTDNNPDAINAQSLSATNSFNVMLEATRVTLTATSDGRGTIVIDPQTNSYNLGAIVHLLAVPDPDQSFLGWTGDETSTSASLDLTLNQNTVVTAHFSKSPRLEIA